MVVRFTDRHCPRAQWLSKMTAFGVPCTVLAGENETRRIDDRLVAISPLLSLTIVRIDHEKESGRCRSISYPPRISFFRRVDLRRELGFRYRRSVRANAIFPSKWSKRVSMMFAKILEASWYFTMALRSFTAKARPKFLATSTRCCFLFEQRMRLCLASCHWFSIHWSWINHTMAIAHERISTVVNFAGSTFYADVANFQVETRVSPFFPWASVSFNQGKVVAFIIK